MIEGQQGVTWRDWCALSDAAERLGFEGLFRSDHYFSARGVSGVGATDAWTVLGALAERTTTLRLGTLVSPVTFRPPAVLAKAALTVDLISGGRADPRDPARAEGVVGAEQSLEAHLLRTVCERAPIRPGEPLLAFDHQARPHGR
jgi:hypothetical protein